MRVRDGAVYMEKIVSGDRLVILTRMLLKGTGGVSSKARSFLHN